MTDDDRNVIRTKLMLLEAKVYRTQSGKRWAICWIGDPYFRFQVPDHILYKSEDEALADVPRLIRHGKLHTVRGPYAD